MIYGILIVGLNAISAILGVALMQLSQWHRSVAYRLTTALMLCALAINCYGHLKAMVRGEVTGTLGEFLLSSALLLRIGAGIMTNQLCPHCPELKYCKNPQLKTT